MLWEHNHHHILANNLEVVSAAALLVGVRGTWVERGAFCDEEGANALALAFMSRALCRKGLLAGGKSWVRENLGGYYFAGLPKGSRDPCKESTKGNFYSLCRAFYSTCDSAFKALGAKTTQEHYQCTNYDPVISKYMPGTMQPLMNSGLTFALPPQLRATNSALTTVYGGKCSRISESAVD